MKRQGGFTLVELLLALLIGAIVLSMIFVSLNLMIRQRQAVIGFSTPYAVGPQILDQIESDLKNAYFYDLKENDSFWGADAEINGHEADGLSFVTCTLSRVGEESLKSTIPVGQEQVENRVHARKSPTTEVQYVCRQSPNIGDCLELWRREDFYVDDSIHDGGIYRLVCDRVFDFKLEYVSRSTSSAGPNGGDKAIDNMRKDGWSSIEERGLPRAVIVSISIYGREGERNWEHEPEVFVFRRWIPLPQVHESTQSEGQIATWDGSIKEIPSSPVAPGAKGGAKGAGGKPGAQNPFGNGARGGAPAGGAANPFANALGNRAPRGGSNSGGFGSLFHPH